MRAAWIRLVHRGRGSLEQVRRRRDVATRERTVAGAPEVLRRSKSELRDVPVTAPELRVVVKGLLEVVAGNLLELRRSLAGVLLEPAGETLVQRGANALGKCVVGGV